MDTGDETAREEAMRRRANDHGFNTVLGYEIEDVGPDWVRASVPHTDEFVNPPTETVMHGGVVASALDATMGYAVMSALYNEPGRTAGPTLTLSINYVGTANEPLDVRGTIVHMGQYVAFLDGEVIGQESDKQVATAHGLWLIFDE